MKSGAEAWLELADGRLQARELTAVPAAFRAAQRCGADPDRCGAGCWLAAMLLEDFEAAWRESDAMVKRGTPDAHRFWNGEDLDGKSVIVRCLHGFGDAAQMLRYAPLLRARAASVIFEVPPRLLPLASCFRGVERVITWGQGAPAAPPLWEVQVEIMELPYLFRTTVDDLPMARTYLELPDALVEQAAIKMGRTDKRRVGIVWAGGGWNPERSIPFDLLKPLLRVEGVEFWNLQGSGAAGEAEGTSMRPALAITGNGLLALAATIANLDLVITIDTLAAHLAGALGRPAWLLLPYAADWRWIAEREDSPWYPSLRLFRQREPGDWAGVVARAREALVA